ncbi:MAG: type II/IV secretion system protein [Desulfobacterales bacterium]|nr:type II/IV secretion system protein [Desulfobacterales bacterium]MBF0398762.1 type II/IV secretion system protein [Desulfobacterales bacterium]
MKIKKRLGEMLVEGELLTEEQLKQAITDHKKKNMKLGQYLVNERIVSESQIIDLLSKQLKLRIYRQQDFEIDTELSKVIPVELSKKYHIVPLSKVGSLLTIATNDPLDINAIDAIEIHTNCEVEIVLCSEQEISSLITTIYGAYSAIDQVLENIPTEDMEIGLGEEATGGVKAEEVEAASLQNMVEQAPVIRLVNSILSQAVREGVSDIHISPENKYVQIRFRVDGDLHDVPAPPKSLFLPMVSRFKLIAGMDIASSRIPQDGRFTIKVLNKEINIRASSLPTIYGENLVLRLLDTSGGVYTLEQLGMNESDRNKVEAMIVKPYGMILVTGPTGSGKSTTLYSILNILNQPDVNIITLEDPVEYRMERIRQVQCNPKAGLTFSSGLRSILRQDPDVIMVGEIRDGETAQIAVQSALTGHRVLSTVHTNDAAGAFTRLIEMGIEPFLVASVMLVSIAQRLVRKICPNCKEPYQPQQSVLSYWGIDKVENARFAHGKGCPKCMNSGYKGRAGVYEVLVIDETVQDMIVRGKTGQEIVMVLRKTGKLNLLKDDAAIKILRGITTLEEAASAVMA